MRTKLLLFGTMLLGLVLANCGGAKMDIGKNQAAQQTDHLLSKMDNTPAKLAQKPDSSLIDTKKDTIPKIASPSITKIINGQKIEMVLDGKYHKVLKFEDREYPLEIKEVYPNIVYFDKYEPLKLLPYHALDSTIIYNKVKDKIEFYQENKLINTFIVDEHNPYLKAPKGIRIMQHYSNAEGSYFIPIDKRESAGSVTQYHLRQWVENQESMTKIIYWKRGLTSSGGIIESASTMIVLDSMGNEIFHHEYDGFCSMPALSPDGQYALYAILPEETVNNAGVKTQTEGFEIWNTRTNTLLHREMNDDPDMWIESPNYRNYPKVLGVSYSFINSNNTDYRSVSSNPVSKVYHFDFEKLLLYEYYVSVKETDEALQYFIKNKKYRTWDDLDIEKKFKPLNYGK